MERLITNAHCLEVYSVVRDGETDAQALERARAYYQESIRHYEEIIAESGNGENDYWLNCLNTQKAIVASLQIETEAEYLSRSERFYLEPPAQEVTEDRYWDMLEVLPPCAFTSNADYEMFYVSEALHLSYHHFYLHDKHTGKFWSKICDARDRATWIDNVLGLRAA